jgi:DNA-binding NtrC family response regulator
MMDGDGAGNQKPASPVRRRLLMNANRTVDDLSAAVLEALLLEPQPHIKEFMEGVEKRLIIAVLERVFGNQKEAARILGIKYSTFNEKIKRYKISFRIQPVLGETTESGYLS